MVEEIGKIKGKEGEIEGRVHARVDVPQEPFVVVHESLSNRRVRRKRISIVAWTENRRLRHVDIVALVELSLEIWQPDHQREIVPHIAVPKLQRLSHETWSSDTCSRSFSAFDSEHSLALQAIKVLREPAAISAEVMPLDDQREQRVDLIEGIQQAK